ncbi:uncharacterized protein LOC142977318 [Anticarsia gemmatalis]|uniref:uncharacterized protein LOC142977318 n=1 Tax=Anticarsia gemmatalis TaxID=129554 RepID=UPI003F75DDE7
MRIVCKIRKMIETLKKIKCKKLPVVRKCCFCVPVYVGIALFGYTGLMFALITIPMIVFELVDEVTNKEHTDVVDYHNPLVHLPLILVAALVDVAQTVLLLVGAHKRNKLLLKIYFYLALVFQLAILVVDIPFLVFSEYRENAMYFLFLVLNIYLLYLVHNVVYIREDSREVQYIAYEEHRSSL